MKKEGNKGYRGYVKKIYFLISLIPFISLAQGQQDVNPNGYNKFYYENGVLSSEGNMRDSRPDGYWKTYSPNGKIKSEGNRKNYELDSIWKFYDGNGKLLTEINYSSGKKGRSKKGLGPKRFYSDRRNIFCRHQAGYYK